VASGRAWCGGWLGVWPEASRARSRRSGGGVRSCEERDGESVVADGQHESWPQTNDQGEEQA
jgi:hypothetical protein